VTEIDGLFAEVCEGDEAAFAGWMGRVERPIRLSLQRYARAVDVEGVVQETLMRMWLYARDRGRELTGENASLRFAIGMARNIARSEARRLKREVHLPPEERPEVAVPPEPAADPGLARAIAECLGRLAGSPLKALRARLDLAPIAPDRQIAQAVGMTLNTFLQNIVRARRHLTKCLEGKNVPLQEHLS
jgi:DNA-directed RNA polymerase specialized sigma24 family protein